MNWGFDHDKTSNFSYDKAEYCEYGDCGNCQMCEAEEREAKENAQELAEFEAWNAGHADGETATRMRGGTRGAEWNADQKGYIGVLREEYISGFNAALDQYRDRENNNDDVS